MFRLRPPPAMAHRARPGPPLRRRVRVRRAVDRDLLPPIVPQPPAAARRGAVLSDPRGRPGRRLPRLPPLPSDAGGLPRPGGARRAGHVPHDRGPPDTAADLDPLARQAGLSSHQLFRAFRRVLGVSPREYGDARRRRPSQIIAQGASCESRHLRSRLWVLEPSVRARAAALGMTPATYRRGGRGATIRFTVVTSPLGALLVAATERGVCRISLGDGRRPGARPAHRVPRLHHSARTRGS